MLGSTTSVGACICIRVGNPTRQKIDATTSAMTGLGTWVASDAPYTTDWAQDCWNPGRCVPPELSTVVGQSKTDQWLITATWRIILATVDGNIHNWFRHRVVVSPGFSSLILWYYIKAYAAYLRKHDSTMTVTYNSSRLQHYNVKRHQLTNELNSPFAEVEDREKWGHVK